MKKIRFYFVDLEVARAALRDDQGRAFINVKKTLDDGYIDLWVHDPAFAAERYGARVGETLACID